MSSGSFGLENQTFRGWKPGEPANKNDSLKSVQRSPVATAPAVARPSSKLSLLFETLSTHLRGLRGSSRPRLFKPLPLTRYSVLVLGLTVDYPATRTWVG